MRMTTRRNRPTRMAKNGPARGKYCIWPMVILKLQGGWEKSPARPNNEDLPSRFRVCLAPLSYPPPQAEEGISIPSLHAGEGRWGRLIAWAKAETSTERRPSKLEGRLCPAMEDYRSPALILSSTAEPGHNSLSESALSGVSAVLRCLCRSSASRSRERAPVTT